MPLFRAVALQKASMERAADGGDLTIDMAFSSDEPYERWWGIEVLDHGEKSIRLGRLNDGAALLFNHNTNDLRGVHVPGSVRTDGKVMRGKVRVTSATEAGREAIALVDTGILSKASVGYQILKVIEQSDKKDANGEPIQRELDGALFERVLTRSKERDPGDVVAFRRALDAAAGKFERGTDSPTTYRVVDWEPFENSLVTIPADPTVGVGRSFEEITSSSTNPATTAVTKGATMADVETAAAGASADTITITREERPAAVEAEKSRVRAIDHFAKANDIDPTVRNMWVNQGYSLEEVGSDILKIKEERGKSNPQPASRLGLTTQETKRFSLSRAILAARENNWTNAGFELEASRAIAQKLNVVPNPHKFYVPFEVMERGVEAKRDMSVASAGNGGYLVSTDNQGFIDMVRNRSVAFRMGARRLSGLQGNVTIPRQSAAATAYWLANEATAITESQQTLVQVALSPKTVGAYTEISRNLLLQSSPGAEGIVTDDLAQVVALAADLAALEGTGAGGQPTGLSGTAGIGSVSGTSLAASGVIEFMTDVAGSNVTPAAPGYVTTPAIAGLLMARPELPTTGTTRLWQGNPWDGSLFGVRAMTSNQLTAATMIFGDWQELVIAEWGVLEVEVHPYANFAAGIVGVRAMYSLDIGVRRPFAFSRATTIT